MKSLLLPLFCLSLLFSSCNGQTSKSVNTIEVSVFEENLKTTENPQLIDVRTPEEFAEAHLENAKNVNWNGSDFEVTASKYDKTKPVFVYCKLGGRSAKAADKLAEMGFTNIYNLDGGITKWNESNFPVKK